MEYTQWEKSMNEWKTKTGLNPCCNGIYSMRQLIQFTAQRTSLNPCCNGIYSMRQWINLQLVESLNPCCNGIYSMRGYVWV